VQARGDFESGDARNGSRGGRAFDFFKDAAFGDGNHHHAAGGLLAGPIAAGQTKRVAQQHRNRIAVTDSDTSLSYAELWGGISGLGETIVF